MMKHKGCLKVILLHGTSSYSHVGKERTLDAGELAQAQ
jgi:hypothetical protein